MQKDSSNGKPKKKTPDYRQVYYYSAYNLDCTLTEVVVPAEINGIPVTELWSRTFKDSKAEKVVLPDGIEKIRDAFCDLKTLRSVNIPAGVKEISANAFRNCTALMELRIPPTVTRIEDRMGSLPFYGCGGARETGESCSFEPEYPGMEVSSFGTESETRYYHDNNVTIIDGAAYSSGSKPKISVPAYDKGPYGNLTLIVDRGSYAEDYARRMGIQYKYPE